MGDQTYHKAIQVKFQIRIRTINAIRNSGQCASLATVWEQVGIENRTVRVTGNEAETALKLEYIRLLLKIGSPTIYSQCIIHG